MEKYCKKCDTIKDIKNFSKKGKGYQTFCKECNKSYLKQHYIENAQYYIDKKDKRRKELAEYVKAIKANKPCLDCGKLYAHYIMEFDHLDAFTKIDAISGMVRLGRSLRLIKKEIAKCELVCANCHRERTYKRYSGIV